jgi:Sec-independent protein translocase protein TatA
MFGISWAEFLVIVIVAILVVPVKYWPDVARALARVVKYVRKIIWKITDASEQIKDQIDLEKPINDIINTTTNDVLNDFSEPIKKIRKSSKVKKK